MPWQWEGNEKPLCKVEIVDGNIDDCAADVHAEFANAFVGGGVMTGDAAMEETLFLVKPELMVAMYATPSLQLPPLLPFAHYHRCRRMLRLPCPCRDSISSHRHTTLTRTPHTTTEGPSKTVWSTRKPYAYQGRKSTRVRAGLANPSSSPETTSTTVAGGPTPPPRVAAIDAVRGGGPAMTERALLRDMSKARAAFEGAVELATGHWGCGAYGNHNDLMFIKQWLAASEAGVRKMYYHDFNRNQLHHIFPLIRKLGHLTVGELWAFLLELSRPLVPCNMKDFSVRVADISTGKLKPGGNGETPG